MGSIINTVSVFFKPGFRLPFICDLPCVELGVACLGAEGDWLTEPIVLPCGQSGQRCDHLCPHYKPEFLIPAESAVDFPSASPVSYTDSFELNDDVISSILGNGETCYQHLPTGMLTTWHPVTSDHQVISIPCMVKGSDDVEAASSSVSRSRKRDLAKPERGDDTTCRAPASKNRKKEQNKSAALKYRQKKREEQSKLEDRRDQLEEQNQKLQSDVVSLENEIMYLKQLWQELHGKHQT